MRSALGGGCPGICHPDRAAGRNRARREAGRTRRAGDLRAEVVRIQLELPRVGAGPIGCAHLRSTADRRLGGPGPQGGIGIDLGPLGGVIALAFQVIEDVVAGFVAHHEGQLIRVLHVRDQRQGEDQDRLAIGVQRLKGVGGHPAAAVDGDAEGAAVILSPFAAHAFGHRLHRFNHLRELARRPVGLLAQFGGFLGRQPVGPRRQGAGAETEQHKDSEEGAQGSHVRAGSGSGSGLVRGVGG